MVLGDLVFSFAMVLYELMTLKYPYYELKSAVQITKAITSGQLPYLSPELELKFQSIYHLWRSCLHPNPAHRMTAHQLRD